VCIKKIKIDSKNMIRRMTSSSVDRNLMTSSSSLQQLSSFVSDNKWLVLGTAIVIGGVVFALNADDIAAKATKKKRGALKRGNTTVDAGNIQTASSLRVSSTLTQSMVRNFREKLDTNHNGTVDLGEWIQHSMSLRINTSIATHLFSAMDVNDDDSLELEEIFDFVSQLESGSVQQKLDCIFSFISHGKSDSMSRSDCKKVLALLLTSEEAEQTVRNIFTAGNSAQKRSISRSDFVEGLTKSDGMEADSIIALSQIIVKSVCVM